MIINSSFKERNGAWSTTAQELYEVQQLRKFYENKENKLKELLILHSEGISSTDNLFAYIKDFRKGTIDYASIPVLKDVNLELYRKEPTVTWKLMKV